MAQYEVTAADGTVYQIDADSDQEAARVERWINERIAAGDTQLQGEAPPNVNVIHEEPVESSTGGAALRGALSGGYLDWEDEIAAFGNAAGLAPIENLMPGEQGQQTFANNPEGFWAAFNENMRRYNVQEEADVEQHPVAYNVGRVGGALASAGPMARGVGSAVVNLASHAPRVAIPVAARMAGLQIGSPLGYSAGRGAVQGGAYGTVAGAGAGEGNRAQSAALGGLTGAVGGAAIDTSITALAPAIRRYASTIFGRAPREEALTQIVQALRRDGYDVSSPSAVQLLRSELSSFAGRPVSLADIGSATRARAGVGLRTPSGAQNQSIDQVLARGRGSGDRLSQDIRQNVAPRTDVHAIDDALVTQRAQEAEHLRQRALFEGAATPPPTFVDEPSAQEIADAFEGGVNTNLLNQYNSQQIQHAMSRMTPAQRSTAEAYLAERGGAPIRSRVVNDPTLHALARTETGRRALSAAVQRSRGELELLQAQGLPTEHLGAGIFDEAQLQQLLESGGALDVRTLDALKRFLDDEVNALYRRGQGSTFAAGEAQQVRALRDAVRDRMRTAVPEYGEYLDAYSGSSDLIDALRAGRGRAPGEPGRDVGFDRLDPERIAAEQTARTSAEQEFYRVGAARRLEDIVRSTRDTQRPASRILSSDADRARVEALGLQPGAVERLSTGVGQERQLDLLGRELAGSQTAQREAALADAASDIETPFNPMSGYGWMGALLRGIRNRAVPQRMASVNEELLPRMIETNPNAIDEIINDLERRGQHLAAQEIRRARRAGTGSRAFGALIGSPVALPGE